jgi:hypothetical protein
MPAISIHTEAKTTSSSSTFNQLCSQFVEVGAGIMRRAPADTSAFKKRWRSLFGASPVVCSKICKRLKKAGLTVPNQELKHVLWALMLMKKYSAEADLAKDAGPNGAVDEKTFRTWAWDVIEAIALLEPSVIVWENRRVGDIMNDALISVDGTDTEQRKKRPFWKGWYSHKLNGAGTRWEVGVCLITGVVVWIHGPFPCGRWNDLTIFRHAMLSHLDDGEKVEADDGYKAEFTKTLTPANNSRTASDATLRQRNRNRHETINKRLKDWKCLNSPCKHDLAKHSAMFRVVLVICQLAIESGESLFHLDYNDEEFSIGPF